MSISQQAKKLQAALSPRQSIKPTPFFSGFSLVLVA